MSNEIIAIQNVHGYVDENGTAWLNAEDVAIGLGFVEVMKDRAATTGGKFPIAVRWRRINDYLHEFGYSVDISKGSFLPENMVYLLAMKASNETAKNFQWKLANEIIPQIRKTGSYSVQPKEITSEFLFQIAEQLRVKEQQCLLEKARADENQEVKNLYDATNASEEYWLPMKTVADVLDVIGVGRNNLYKFLREQHILSQNNEPMRCYQEMGYIRSSYVSGFKNQVICVVSLKGLKFIFKKLQNSDLLPRTTKMEEWLKLCTALNNDEVGVTNAD